MSTSQTRPKTPPTEYGPSLTPPTLEEINICHLSIDVELSENTDNAPPLAVAENSIATTGTGEADNDSNRRRSGRLWLRSGRLSLRSGRLSPRSGCLSPRSGCLSPRLGCLSPRSGRLSPCVPLILTVNTSAAAAIIIILIQLIIVSVRYPTI